MALMNAVGRAGGACQPCGQLQQTQRPAAVGGCGAAVALVQPPAAALQQQQQQCQPRQLLMLPKQQLLPARRPSTLACRAAATRENQALVVAAPLWGARSQRRTCSRGSSGGSGSSSIASSSSIESSNSSWGGGAAVARRRSVACAAGAADVATLAARFGEPAFLDKAARRFRAGVEQGLDPDFIVAVELGAVSRDELSETQQQYADKIRARLEARASELAAEEAERRRGQAEAFEAGKNAYGRGLYEQSAQLLETAVEQAGRSSVLGGEALMWLALAYQAVGRERECVEAYKWLEDNHPLPKVRKQAADLRYIMEAPRLALSPDERVTIPLLNSEDAWVKKGRKSPKTAPKYGAREAGAKKAKKSYWDIDWEAPLLQYIPDRWYVRVAWAVLLVGLTVYLNAHATTTR